MASGVADDAGDVARRGERADLQRARGMADQLLFERAEVDVPVGVLADDDDVGDRLAPRQLVGVVFERADEHDRPLVWRDVSAEPVAVLERGRDAEAEDADQLVDGAGAPDPAKITA